MKKPKSKILTSLTNLKNIFQNPASERDTHIYANSLYKELGFETPSALLSSLCDDKILFKIEMTPQKGVKRYCYCSRPEPSLYEIVNAFWEKTYFCNLTAVYFHNLTNQIPQVVYVARESVGRLTDTRSREVLLSDAQIFQAFIKPHRYTNNVYHLKFGSIIFTERVDRGRIGVIKTGQDSKLLPDNSSVTSLERTLVDVCINPQYNGGVTSVVEYFAKAKAKINTKLLIDVYNKLDLVYPYWQVIGFMCDKVGAKKTANALYNSFKIQNIFYLDHMAKTDWQFNEKWQLKHPKMI